MSAFVTADTHFNHGNIIKYCHRPFDSQEQMNEALIHNWNSCVKNSDTIYHLGDFGMGTNANLLRIATRLNGQKFLIPGSHDRIKNLVGCFDNIYPPIYILRHRNTDIVLCHYALRVWYKSHYGSYHLYGHSHGTLDSHGPWGKSMDVGVDNCNFKPISLDQVAEIMKTRPDNFNLVKEPR
jgi:calcineurin-like phosphoesterase family protein